LLVSRKDSSNNPDYDSNIVGSNNPHPDHRSGQQYDQTNLCTNTYSEMDQACAVLGIVAALLWLLDFCLILGLCGSSGRYGEHRNYYGGRGQFGPEDPEEDDIPAGGHTLPGGGAGGGGFGYYGEGHGGGGQQVGDDRFYDYTSDPHRKRELEWLENRTRDDPQRHVQGPIPLSMQLNYLSGITTPPVSTVAGTTAAATASASGEREDQHSLAGATLSPPPRPKVLVEPPDSPTLPSALQKEKMMAAEREKTTPPVSVGLSRNSTGVKRAAKAPAASGTLAPVDQELDHPLAHDMPSQVVDQPAQDEALQDHVVTQDEVPFTASSSRYIEFPPGPACYVFDSSQHEYLPSFVNMAARIEKKHSLKHTLSHSSTGDGDDVGTPGTATTPRVGTPRRVDSPRVMVTGLGFDVVSRDDAEIAAEEEHQRQQRQQGVDTSSSSSVITAVPDNNGSYSPATVAAVTAVATSAASESPTSSIRQKTSRPPKIKLPKSESFGPTSNSSTSTSSPVTPKATSNLDASPTLASPSVSSRPSAAQLSPHLATEKQLQQQAEQSGRSSPTITAKPSLTKRKTNSKLSVVTLKNIQQQQQSVAGSSVAGGRGASPSALSSSSSLGGHLSDSGTASPRSQYVGDF